MKLDSRTLSTQGQSRNKPSHLTRSNRAQRLRSAAALLTVIEMKNIFLANVYVCTLFRS